MQPTVELTQAQVQAFHQHGFAKLPSISTQQELRLMRTVYDDLFDSTEGATEGLRFDLASMRAPIGA